MADPFVPQWVTTLTPLLVVAASATAWLFGKGSSSGKDSARLKNVETEVEGIKKIMNDTVIAVSNHNQSINSMDVRMRSIETELKQANIGIAIVVERTKNI